MLMLMPSVMVFRHSREETGQAKQLAAACGACCLEVAGAHFCDACEGSQFNFKATEELI